MCIDKPANEDRDHRRVFLLQVRATVAVCDVLDISNVANKVAELNHGDVRILNGVFHVLRIEAVFARLILWMIRGEAVLSENGVKIWVGEGPNQRLHA